MQICTNCGHQNPVDVPICLNCASSLGVSCPSCGHDVVPGNKYCGQCGTLIESQTKNISATESALSLELSPRDQMLNNLRSRMPSTLTRKIAQTAKELVGQRREVTVLFLDIVNFTAVSHTIGSEETYLVVDEMMHILAEVVYKYEGTIDKFTGDGMMALFGIPINHENDPERTIRAALDMQTALRPLGEQLHQKYNLEFNIRMGINTGLVIAGNLGSQHHMEYMVIGDTVNLASRLENQAKPGTILVSFRTYQRTKPIFNFKTLPPIQLKGIPGLSKTFQPLGTRHNPGQLRGLPGLKGPLVGRKTTLSRLKNTLASVVENQLDHTVLLSGDAGMGKTRLIAEFRNSVDSETVNIYQGTCAAYMRASPYRVVADVIRNIIQISETDSEEIQSNALLYRLEQLNLEHREIFPYLLNVLGINQPDPILEARLKILDPSMLQHQIHSALRVFFIAETQFTTIVLIFDDLHWVDPASRDFLIFFSQSLVNFSILLILIARNFDANDLTRSLVKEPHIQAGNMIRIHLEPLSDTDTRLLVDQLIHETSSQANTIKKNIADRALGNPYYTEEIVRILIDHGGMVQKNGTWVITSTADDLIDTVPGTLQNIILARFDQLSDNLRLVLHHASVLGQSFVIGLLQSFTQIDPDQLLSLLEELEKRGFVIIANLGIHEGYLFKHPLIQETIYSTLLKRDLRNLHLRVAKTIETDLYWLPGDRSEALAFHYAESTTPHNAIPYLINSAKQATQRFANETVVQHYRKAMKLMADQEYTAAKEYYQVQIGIGMALKFTGELEEASQILEDAIEKLSHPSQLSIDEDLKFILLDGLRELADIRTREADLDTAISLLEKGMTYLEDGLEKFPIQWRRLADRMAWVYFRQARLEEAFNLADLAMRDIQAWETDDPITLASLSNTLGGIYWMRSRHEDAIENVNRSLEIYRDLNFYWGMAHAYTNLGVLKFSLGDWSEAVMNMEEAEVLRTEYGYIAERPTNLKNLGEILICTGDYILAREKFETGREISQKLGMNLFEAYAELGLCRLSIYENKIAEASEHLDAANLLVSNTENELDDRTVQINFLEALIAGELGEYKTGKKLAHKAFSIAESSGYLSEKTETLRVLGILYAGSGEFETAYDWFNKSITAAKKQNDSYREAQALFQLGKAYHNQAELDPSKNSKYFIEARNVFDEAIKNFEDLGAKQDLHEAQTIRNKIPVNAPKAPLHFGDPQSLVQTQVAQLRSRLGLPDGEWYQAVILSLKLIPQQGVDPEFIFETIAILLPSFIEIVVKNKGHVLRRQDSLIVVFGAPVAHEDDVEIAVDTAMQLVNYYQELHSQTQMPITIRVGVSNGKVIAGWIGSKPNREFMVAGDPVQHAEQIADFTNSINVWVTETVRNRTSFRFEYSAISSELTQNFTDQVIYELEGLREQMGPVRGLIGLQPPFIGRKTELNAMNNIRQILTRGLGAMVWISGVPGIGKSRLMSEFSSEISDQGMIIWQGTCTVRRAEYAFSLFSDLLTNILDLQPTFSPDQINAAIEKKISDWPAELQDSRPFIQLLTGVQPSGALGDRVIALEPEQLRRQIFVAIRQLINVQAHQRPLVLLLDDLQWIDPISAELLLFISNLIISTPLLIIGAQRSTEIGSSDTILDQIRGMHPEHTLHISIQPLTVPECQTLLDEFLPSSDLPFGVMNLMLQQSGGNPYFIEEFIRMLIEQDYLFIQDGELRVNQTFFGDTITIPSSLETLIRSRIDKLPNPAKRLIQVAAVIGNKFDEKLLVLVSAQEDITPKIELLQARGMLRQAAENEQWEFSHPLIEAIVYNSVLKVQRKILHSRIANFIERQWLGNEIEKAEDLAYHYGKAEENPKALQYLILAGDRAAAQYANEAALGYYEQAEKLTHNLPETSAELRWRIIRGLGNVYQFIGNFDAAIRIMESGLPLIESQDLSNGQRAALFRQLGETVQKKGDQNAAVEYFNHALTFLTEVQTTQDQGELAITLARLGWSYFYLGEFTAAQEAATQAHEIAQQANNLAALATVDNLLGGIGYRQGNFDKALEHTNRAISIWEHLGYSWGVAAGLSNMGILEVTQGNWENALTHFESSLKMRQEMGDIEGVAITNNNLGSLSHDRGNLEEAATYFKGCLSIAAPFQLGWQIANATTSLAQIQLYLGNIKVAEDLINEGRAIAEKLAAQELLVVVQITEVELLMAKSSYEKAIQLAKEATKNAAKIGGRFHEARAWRVFSEIFLLINEPEKANQQLAQAWEALSQSTNELETGRVTAMAGRISFELNDLSVARKYYHQAQEIFKRLGAQRDINNLEAIFADHLSKPI
jgi:predicted ATPase/class 3 adenylate cyclase